ncbi:hypothetical protein B0H34DRAFT_297639 [Crassisporium funariophilum]|nr:hypothetical protein B0H34DRAFT_297639 [Crassisporium funariophilum]
MVDMVGRIHRKHEEGPCFGFLPFLSVLLRLSSSFAFVLPFANPVTRLRLVRLPCCLRIRRLSCDVTASSPDRTPSPLSFFIFPLNSPCTAYRLLLDVDRASGLDRMLCLPSLCPFPSITVTPRVAWMVPA